MADGLAEMADGMEDGMAEWRNGRMAEWGNGEMAEWWNGGMAELAEWRNGMAGKMARLQGTAEWRNGYLPTTFMVTPTTPTPTPTPTPRRTPFNLFYYYKPIGPTARKLVKGHLLYHL
jgi:hypothetical protein